MDIVGVLLLVLMWRVWMRVGNVLETREVEWVLLAAAPSASLSLHETIPAGSAATVPEFQKELQMQRGAVGQCSASAFLCRVIAAWNHAPAARKAKTKVVAIIESLRRTCITLPPCIRI